MQILLLLSSFIFLLYVHFSCTLSFSLALYSSLNGSLSIFVVFILYFISSLCKREAMLNSVTAGSTVALPTARFSQMIYVRAKSCLTRLPVSNQRPEEARKKHRKNFLPRPFNVTSDILRTFPFLSLFLSLGKVVHVILSYATRHFEFFFLHR